MDLTSINPVVLIASLMVAATPILLAAIGELVVEKSGVLNLGVEGMMIVGAVAGFAIAVTTQNPYLGMIGAVIAGALVALIFAALTQVLMANQVASGLALTLFGLGFSALVGQSYVGIVPPRTAKLDFGFLSDLPVVGRIVFGHDILVYVSLLIVAGTWYWLGHSRGGRVLRAVGENHDSAHALGYKVKRVRILAIMFGGACAGLGGAYLSLVRVPSWTEGMTAGAGWIALALVVFASWRPWRVLAGAYLFGGISVLQLNLQAANARLPVSTIGIVIGLAVLAVIAILLLKKVRIGMFASATLAVAFALGIYIWIFGREATVPFSVEYLSMSPYLITILVLVVMSSSRGRRSMAAPGSLGRSFHAAG